ncbi:Uncharacterized protein DAT39_013979, partial [Clarias magur]
RSYRSKRSEAAQIISQETEIDGNCVFYNLVEYGIYVECPKTARTHVFLISLEIKQKILTVSEYCLTQTQCSYVGMKRSGKE